MVSVIEVRHATTADVPTVTEAYLESSETWVAEVDGELVGFVAIGATSVDHIFVRSDWAGRGIDRRLLELARLRRHTRT